MNALVAGARMPRLSEGCGTADTILVVEAHDEALAAARRIFECSGYPIRTAVGGPAALDTFARERTSLLVVAQAVLEDSLELIPRVRAIDAGVPVCFANKAFVLVS